MAGIVIGGHRGSGCTDSEHALKYAKGKPAENTLESIRRAFDAGAAYVEIDAVRTRDNVVVVTHSTNLADHVFHPLPAPFISDLTLDDVSRLRVGRDGSGIIPTLKDVLDLIASLPPSVLGGFRLNIELKDVKGTTAPKYIPGQSSLVELVAKEVRRHGLPLDLIVFSSFSLSDVMAMAQVLPEARLALLFDEKQDEEPEIYPHAPEPEARYLQFTPANLRHAVELVRLEFVHPEIRTLTNENVSAARALGLKINTWAMHERPPHENPAPVQACLKLAASGQHLAILTDFVPEMRAYVEKVC